MHDVLMVVVVCVFVNCIFLIFFFKQKTAYQMRISDWSSDVCSSDLLQSRGRAQLASEQLPLGVAIGGHALFVQLAQHAGAVEIGRASCRERVCQYVSILAVAVSFKKKITQDPHLLGLHLKRYICVAFRFYNLTTQNKHSNKNI